MVSFGVDVEIWGHKESAGCKQVAAWECVQ